VQITHGNFKGLAYQAQADHPDPDWTLFNVFHPSSSDYYMGMMGEDQKVTQLVNAQRRELDRQKRNNLLRDFQRYASTKMYYMPPPGDIRGFSMSQPWISNFNAQVLWLIASFGGAMESQTIYPYLWYDETKKS
jgi:ABC-type transport system substrate-binding protein